MWTSFELPAGTMLPIGSREPRPFGEAALASQNPALRLRCRSPAAQSNEGHSRPAGQPARAVGVGTVTNRCDTEQACRPAGAEDRETLRHSGLENPECLTRRARTAMRNLQDFVLHFRNAIN